MMADCAYWVLSEKRAGLEHQLSVCGLFVAFVALALTAGKCTGLLTVSWALPICSTIVATLFFTTVYFIGVLIVHADCFLMRNHSITEQPMRFSRTASLFLQEVSSFVER